MVDAAYTALTTGAITSTTVTAGPRDYATMQTALTTPTLDTNGAPSYIKAMSPTDAVSAADAYAGSGFSAVTGNRVRYVIERMCNNAPGTGLPPANAAEIQADCLTYNPTSGGAGDDKEALQVALGGIVTSTVYYRVTVRVDGPRNTLSIAQSIIRF